MKNATRLIATILLLTLAANAAADEQRFTGVERVVAMGDVHGDYHRLTAMLSRARLIDAEHHWDGGPAHLVMTGDMVDRGDASRRVLDLLMRLEDQARQAGGRVHVLLGNHEIMWLTGDFRYTSDADFRRFAPDETESMRDTARERFEAMKDRQDIPGDFGSHFPPGSLALREAVSPEGKYGSWLMAKPVTVVIDDTAFIHAGLSEAYAGHSLQELNSRVRGELEKRVGAWRTLARAGILAPEYPLLDAARALEAHVKSGAFDGQPRAIRDAAEAVVNAPSSIIHDPEGPFWYRGNAVCNALVETDLVDRALDGLDAGALVVSHTPTPGGRIVSRLEGRLVRIDTGERSSALELANGERRAIYADSTEPAAVESETAHRAADRPMSAREIEAFLSEASIVGMEAVGTGVTNPQRVTLERDGVRMRAVFKSEATPTRSTGGLSSRRMTNLADRHVYELAAYRLDRLLGLGMVPPAVERRVGGGTGTLQYWVEGATNDRQRRLENIEPDPQCPLEKDYALLELFDRLIYNTDRTQENILYLPDWRVVLIDHTRAFRTHRGKPDTVRAVSLDRAPGFAARLERLDRGMLNEALGGVLDSRQIRAILDRRDEMLAEWRGNRTDEVAAR